MIPDVMDLLSRPVVRALWARDCFAFGGELMKLYGGGLMPIRPLTLVLGRNSSGKSAILKLLRLALRAAALEPHTASPTTGPGDRHLPLAELGLSSRVLDLVHDRVPSRVFGLGLDLQRGGHVAMYRAQLLSVDGRGDQTYLYSLEAEDFDKARRALELDTAATESAGKSVFRGDSPSGFHGLFPSDAAISMRSAASTLNSALSYLGPLRIHVRDVQKRQEHAVLGVDGAGAADLLANDGELADRVDKWYSDNLGYRLQVRTTLADAFELLTTSPSGTSIPLAQAGEGLHQLLPVVVQQLRHLADDERDILDLVEQPELHLHDAIHPALGTLFVDTAKLGRGSVIVETHSEGLLLRVRRLIAEGSLDANDVAVYFVDREQGSAVVRSIMINRDGELSDWPEGVFLERFQEVIAIQRATRGRQGP